MLKIPVIAIAFFLICSAFARPLAPTSPRFRMLNAYAAGDFSAARELAEKSTTSEARLIDALCDVYDRAHLNIHRGVKTLAGLFENENTPHRIRIEAGLTLGRVIQMMKNRPDLFGNSVDQYDSSEIFSRIINMAPGTVSARDAFFYYFRDLARRDNGKSRRAAFLLGENFIRDFSGNRQLLAPLHLLMEYEYVAMDSDYRNAVRHLRAACDLGLSNPTVERDALFRIGFYYYKHLNDKAAAREFLQKYRKRYPYSAYAAVTQRYLEELEAVQ